MLLSRLCKCVILCLLLISVTYQYDTVFRLPFHKEIKFDKEIVKNPIRIYLQIFRWLFSLTGKGHNLYSESLNANLDIDASIKTETGLISGSTTIPTRVKVARAQDNSMKLYFNTSAAAIQPVYLSATEYGVPSNSFSTKVKHALIARKTCSTSGRRSTAAVSLLTAR